MKGEMKGESLFKLDLSSILNPKSVAVIGASRDPLKIGGVILQNIINDGYKGKIFPVNPNATEIFGLKSHKTILGIPDEVDLAVICVPASLVPKITEECGNKGVKGVVIISSGFAETGREGAALQNEISAVARKHGIHVIGPNCLGIINTHVNLNASLAMPIKIKGHVAFISQSGALADAIFGMAQDSNIGFSKFISVGNRVDIDEADLIRYLADDPLTKVIAVYIEGVKNGRKFIWASRKAAEKKPVVVLKAGRSKAGVRAVASHTGSLAVNDLVFNAACKKGNIIRVYNIRELFASIKALSLQSGAKGNRVLIVTNSGGPGIIASDICEKYSLDVPELPEYVKKRIKRYVPKYASLLNPVDITGTGTPEQQGLMYGNVLSSLRGLPEFDVVLVIVEGAHPPEWISEIKKGVLKAIRNYRKKPVLVTWLGSIKATEDARKELEANSIPTYTLIEDAVDGIRSLVLYGGIKKPPC